MPVPCAHTRTRVWYKFATAIGKYRPDVFRSALVKFGCVAELFEEGRKKCTAFMVKGKEMAQLVSPPAASSDNLGDDALLRLANVPAGIRVDKVHPIAVIHAHFAGLVDVVAEKLRRPFGVVRGGGHFRAGLGVAGKVVDDMVPDLAHIDAVHPNVHFLKRSNIHSHPPTYNCKTILTSFITCNHFLMIILADSILP